MKTMLRRLGGIDVHAVLGVTAQFVMCLGSGMQPLWVNYLADHDDPTGPFLDLWATDPWETPWLTGYLGPLVNWVEHTGDPGAVIKAVAEAWRGVDLYAVNSYDGPYQGEMLGPLYVELMSKAGQAAKGAFYTPMNVSKVLAMMSGVEEGKSVCDPCCGAGGMLIAAGLVMREAGRDPSTALWVANDIDPLAVALTGVNMTVRDMGPHIWLSVGDGLQLGADTDGDPHRTQRPWWERPAEVDPIIDQVTDDLVYHSPPALSYGGTQLFGGNTYARSLGHRGRRTNPDLAPPGKGGAA